MSNSLLTEQSIEADNSTSTFPTVPNLATVVSMGEVKAYVNKSNNNILAQVALLKEYWCVPYHLVSWL